MHRKLSGHSHSTLGGGAHGLSGLLLTNAKYLRDTTHNWVDPIFPGQVPNMAGATTTAGREAITAQHSADVKQYNNAVVASASIRKIVSECIEDTYLQALKKPITGLSSISIRDIFLSLFKQHGKITSARVTTAIEEAQTPWDPATPIQILINKIQKAEDLSIAAEEPLSDKMMVRFGYEQVLRSAAFQDSMKAWRRKPSTDKTWILFKQFMIEEYDDYLEDMVAGDANPYQASLLYTDETLTTLTGIAENLTTDRAKLTEMGVANLTIKTENAALKETVQKLTEKINSLFQKYGALETRVARCEGKKTSTRPSPAATSPTVNPYTRKAKYCFTCGLQPWHSSDKCKLGAPGHKKDATFANKLGGNETNHMVLKE